jgi:hypothetical protein
LSKRIYYCEIYTQAQCITIYETFNKPPKVSYEDFVKAIHLHCKKTNLQCEYYTDKPRLNGWVWLLLILLYLFTSTLIPATIYPELPIFLFALWLLTSIFFVIGRKKYNPNKIPSFMFP